MAVARGYGARRALGVSLGAGAILRAAWRDPAASSGSCSCCPATLDRPRHDPAIARMQRMAELVRAGDLEALADALVADQPAGVRVAAGRRESGPAGRRIACRHQRGAARCGTCRRSIPIDDAADLSVVSCPVLVVGQEGDGAHPAELAEELAERLPDATVCGSSTPTVWSGAHRAELRELVSTFLNGSRLSAATLRLRARRRLGRPRSVLRQRTARRASYAVLPNATSRAPTRVEVRQGVDRGRRRVVERPAVAPARDQRERDAPGAELVGDREGVAVARDVRRSRSRSPRL